MTTSIQPYFQSIIYNEVTQELIGLERGTSVGDEVYLAKIDPVTGIVTPISTIPATNSITLNGGFTIDLVNQWFQFVSNGQLLSVDFATGQIVHSPIIDTSQVAYFDNILYNASDGKIYGLGRNSTSAEVFLGEINPITGHVTLISQQPISTGFSLSGAALNPFEGIYYFKGISEFIGVDTNSGNITTSTPLDFSQSNGDYFEYYYFSGRVTELLSKAENSLKNSIEIFPNPVNDLLTIKADNLTQIQVFDIHGKYNSTNQHPEEHTVDMSSFSPGLYVVKLIHNDEVVVRNILKR